jgi:hypothetical protein
MKQQQKKTRAMVWDADVFEETVKTKLETGIISGLWKSKSQI